MTTELICAYSLSGGYGPIPRFLYYILLIVTFVFQKTKWLVDSTLGASMIFRSIAAVRAVALASARGREIVDLDIIPVYSITGLGMVIAVPLLVWSRTLREAERSARTLVFLWVGLMFIGNMASLASVKKLPVPLLCNVLDTPGCPLTCNVTLPMRQGQQTNAIPFHLAQFLSDTWSGTFSWCASWSTLMGLIFAEGREHPMDLARAQMKSPVGSRRFRRNNANRVANCAICTPPFSIGICIAHAILMEVIMLGPGGLPLGENMTAIGQWGPLVGAAFAMIASKIQWNVSQPDARGDIEQELKTLDLKALRNTEQEVSTSGRTAAGAFDTAAYFKEGYWWGRQADSFPVLKHGGIKWVVREGYLTRFQDLPDSTVRVVHSVDRCMYSLI